MNEQYAPIRFGALSCHFSATQKVRSNDLSFNNHYYKFSVWAVWATEGSLKNKWMRLFRRDNECRRGGGGTRMCTIPAVKWNWSKAKYHYLIEHRSNFFKSNPFLFGMVKRQTDRASYNNQWTNLKMNHSPFKTRTQPRWIGKKTDIEARFDLSLHTAVREESRYAFKKVES